jgi:hypothetical protein
MYHFFYFNNTFFIDFQPWEYYECKKSNTKWNSVLKGGDRKASPYINSTEEERRVLMKRNEGKLTFWIGAVVSTLLICCPAFAQAPQLKMERVLEELRELREKVKEMEEKEEGMLGKILKRVELHGLLEVEASYKATDFRGHPIDKSISGTENTRDSDILLATAALGIDIDFHTYAKGHILFLWEEDETEPVDLDEGTITLGGTENFPFSLIAGKFYIPFGMFNSHFITDPLTLELGETRETSVLVGFTNEMFELKAGAFNGDVSQSRTHDTINSYYGCANITIPPKWLGGVELSGGVSYTNNIAESDNLQDLINPALGARIDDLVPGLGAWLSASYGMFTLELEYIGALGEFESGELLFDGSHEGKRSAPKAWNVELAVRPMEKLELAARYGGSDEIRGGIDPAIPAAGVSLEAFIPKSQYGAVASYNIWGPITVSLEYLFNIFHNIDKQHIITGQLAAEF